MTPTSRMLGSASMRARTHRIGLGLLFATAIFVPALASAQPKPADYPACTRQISESESNAAHAKYMSGKVDYDEGKYESAIQQFRTAYDKDCTKHELLIIISRAYEFNHNEAEAIKALETYLDRMPNAPDAATHRSRIASMKERLAQQQKAAASAASTAPPAGSSNGQNPPPGGEPQGHTIYPWIVVGVGAVGVALGVVFIVTAPSIPPNCNGDANTCQPTATAPQNSKELQAQQDQAGKGKNVKLGGEITVGVGAALVVGGLIWHFLEPTGPSSSGKSRVVPEVGNGYAGLGYSGRF
jgi:tetratricopeptide (TPR) repeat protein